MRKFILVRDLVKSLNEGEARLLEKFMISFDEVKSPESLKMLKLFRILRDTTNNVVESEIIKQISEDYKTDSFNKLLSRLRDKIYDTLTLDANIFRKDAYSEQYQKKIHLRKLTSVASIVHGRGNIPLAIELYEKIIVGCKEFEIYSELIETLSIIQQLKGLSEGIEVYNNINEQVEFYENCRTIVFKAKHYYHEIISLVDFQANPEKKNELLLERIQELEEGLKKTNSATVEYFLLYLKIHYYQVNHDHESAIMNNMKLVDLIKNNKAIYLKRAHANTLIELGYNLLLFRKFNEALKTFEEALQLIPSNSLNTGIAKELVFYCMFYQNNLVEAENLVEELLNSKYYTLSEFKRSQRTFYKANLSFFKRDFQQVHNLLQDCRELENDKEGWNYGIRFLSIINDIERGFFDIADHKIESLRKFISRSKAHASPRFMIGQKIFSQLVRHSYNFQDTFSNNRALFEQLEQEHVWRIRSAELFPFEEWFKTKMTESSYHFKVERLFEKK